MDSANTTMKNMKLPEKMQLEIHSFLIQSYGTLSNQQEYDEFVKWISPSLKTDVNSQIYERILKHNALLKDDKNVTKFIVSKLDNYFGQPDEELVS